MAAVPPMVHAQLHSKIGACIHTTSWNSCDIANAEGTGSNLGQKPESAEKTEQKGKHYHFLCKRKEEEQNKNIKGQLLLET